MSDTKDVAQLVIRYDTGYISRYLLAKRTLDGYWEFIGGKKKEGESIEEAARRELEEELKGIDTDKVDLLEVAEPYPSENDPSYSLYPVLMELDAGEAAGVDDSDLSEEHSEMDWIHLDDFIGYETLGQRKALERLDLLAKEDPQGDVVMAVARKNGDYLMLRRSDFESFSGCWESPGGLMREKESLEDALKRELAEETELSVTSIEREGSSYIGEGSTGYWRIHPFLVDVDGSVSLSEEHDRYKWVDLENIRMLKTYGQLKALHQLELI